jgi:hypothetical protein
VVKSRIQVLLDMLKVNMSIHTILFYHDLYTEHELFRGSVVPSRPRVRAIQNTRPIAYRAKLLGRAHLAERTDPNRLWMLLSGHPEVTFPSTTAKATPAANLPTTAAAAAVAFTVTATLADSTTGVSVATHVATPTVCRKRKARPFNPPEF